MSVMKRKKRPNNGLPEGATSPQNHSIGGAPAADSRPTPAKALELLKERDKGLPIWIRSPKTGTEFYTGFARSKLYELAGKGAIRSVSIREPGQVKGTRLFHLASILEFVAKCETDAKAVTN
jgi:hypothetical protein